MKYVLILIAIVLFLAIGVPLVFNHIGAWFALGLVIAAIVLAINWITNKIKYNK